MRIMLYVIKELSVVEIYHQLIAPVAFVLESFTLLVTCGSWQFADRRLADSIQSVSHVMGHQGDVLAS